jgi:excinuclease ABC subunit A
VLDHLLEPDATTSSTTSWTCSPQRTTSSGPGGGPDGGQIVAAGLSEGVARNPDAVTGPWLAECLGLEAVSEPR